MWNRRHWEWLKIALYETECSPRIQSQAKPACGGAEQVLRAGERSWADTWRSWYWKGKGHEMTYKCLLWHRRRRPTWKVTRREPSKSTKKKSGQAEQQNQLNHRKSENQKVVPWRMPGVKKFHLVFGVIWGWCWVCHVVLCCIESRTLHMLSKSSSTKLSPHSRFTSYFKTGSH